MILLRGCSIKSGMGKFVYGGVFLFSDLAERQRYGPDDITDELTFDRIGVRQKWRMYVYGLKEDMVV